MSSDMERSGWWRTHDCLIRFEGISIRKIIVWVLFAKLYMEESPFVSYRVTWSICRKRRKNRVRRQRRILLFVCLRFPEPRPIFRNANSGRLLYVCVYLLFTIIHTRFGNRPHMVSLALLWALAFASFYCPFLQNNLKSTRHTHARSLCWIYRYKSPVGLFGMSANELHEQRDHCKSSYKNSTQTQHITTQAKTEWASSRLWIFCVSFCPFLLRVDFLYLPEQVHRPVVMNHRSFAYNHSFKMPRRKKRHRRLRRHCGWTAPYWWFHKTNRRRWRPTNQNI